MQLRCAVANFVGIVSGLAPFRHGADSFPAVSDNVAQGFYWHSTHLGLILGMINLRLRAIVLSPSFGVFVSVDSYLILAVNLVKQLIVSG